MQSKKDHSDKLVQFHIFAETLVVVILWGAFKYYGRFIKAKIRTSSPLVWVYPEQQDASSPGPTPVQSCQPSAAPEDRSSFAWSQQGTLSQKGTSQGVFFHSKASTIVLGSKLPKFLEEGCVICTRRPPAVVIIPVYNYPVLMFSLFKCT